MQRKHGRTSTGGLLLPPNPPAWGLHYNRIALMGTSLVRRRETHQKCVEKPGATRPESGSGGAVRGNAAPSMRRTERHPSIQNSVGRGRGEKETPAAKRPDSGSGGAVRGNAAPSLRRTERHPSIHKTLSAEGEETPADTGSGGAVRGNASPSMPTHRIKRASLDPQKKKNVGPRRRPTRAASVRPPPAGVPGGVACRCGGYQWRESTGAPPGESRRRGQGAEADSPLEVEAAKT
jgi:hypothetical protein